MQFLTDTLSGTPTQTGAFPITIVATDAAGCVGSQDYVVTVTCVGVTITVDPADASRPVAVGSPFGPVTFTASGGTGPYTFVEDGSPPHRDALRARHALRIAHAAGHVPVHDHRDGRERLLGLDERTRSSSTCPTITVTNPATTTGHGRTRLQPAFTPDRRQRDDDVLDDEHAPDRAHARRRRHAPGTTTQTGTFPIVVKATDANGCTGTGATYTLVITCQTITVTNPGVNTGTVDAPFSQTFTASGLLGTATWSETGTLPAGVTLDASTGTLSGTPTVPGSFPITVKVTDANGCFATLGRTP